MLQEQRTQEHENIKILTQNRLFCNSHLTCVFHCFTLAQDPFQAIQNGFPCPVTQADRSQAPQKSDFQDVQAIPALPAARPHGADKIYSFNRHPAGSETGHTAPLAVFCFVQQALFLFSTWHRFLVPTDGAQQAAEAIPSQNIRQFSIKKGSPRMIQPPDLPLNEETSEGLAEQVKIVYFASLLDSVIHVQNGIRYTKR